ncbi:MAG: PIN domain-containing protein [Candidatus Heimdallarchaeota archaeon]|nr:PIN domain-containing protein [Candidatus Heimdallarchaeota archaeon]
MLIILDSSMLMLPLEKRINLSSEIERIITQSYEIVVPKIVINELTELLRSSSSVTTRKANFALNLAQNYSILESQEKIHTDEEILRLALEHKAIVATNDRELRLTLREKGIAVISLHGKNRLSLFGYV